MSFILKETDLKETSIKVAKILRNCSATSEKHWKTFQKYMNIIANVLPDLYS